MGELSSFADLFDRAAGIRHPDPMTNRPIIPDAFAPMAIASAYATSLGPLYVDHEQARLGLVSTDALANIAGVVHGGALVTLADIALFVIGARGGMIDDAVTLTLSTNFVSPARLDRFLVASGRIVREGRSILFIDGEITDEANVCMTFAGTLKRIRPR